MWAELTGASRCGEWAGGTQKGEVAMGQSKHQDAGFQHYSWECIVE